MTSPALPATTLRRRVFAWAAWDWGGAAFNAVITTFVFTVYLTKPALFADPALREGTAAYDQAKASLSGQLGFGLSIAGIVVAILAPALGQRADSGGNRKRWLAIHTWVIVAAMLGMFFTAPHPPFFVLGVALVAIGTVFYELASVNYNAMLPQVSTPATIGRVSAIGWASGYLGGIVLLLIVLFGFIGLTGDPLLPIPADDGLRIRLVAVACAAWTALFSIPVLLAVPELPPTQATKLGFFASYRVLGRHIAQLWREHRNVLRFLVASAVFRDGLTGVFTFGGVLAAGVFGFSDNAVVLFAIAANVVAGVSTLLSGRLDDRIGPKRVILGSLVGLVVAGVAVFLARDAGAIAFWIGGLLLCLFVGPAQTASRSMLARMAPQDREGEYFGLYATTGRVATFLAPAAFSVFVTVSHDQAWGIIGIVLVLFAGLLLLLPVKPVGVR